GVEEVLREGLGALRCDGRARDHAGGADLADAFGDQLELDRLAVDLLHAPGRLVGGQLGDLVEQWLGVLVAGPQTFEVEHADPAELADLDRRRGRHHPVHRRGHERQVEAERVDLPRDVDVFGVASSAARDDRDVVESVRPSTGLADADLDLSHWLSSVPSAPVKELSLPSEVSSPVGPATAKPAPRQRPAQRGLSAFRIWRATVAFIWYTALRRASRAALTTLPPVICSTVSSPSMSAWRVASVAL